MHGNEYTKPTVSSNGCSYTTLSKYNQNYYGVGGSASSSMVAQARSNEVVIVPSYGGVGYGNVPAVQRQPTCNGYFSVNSAYPNYPACGGVSSNLCGL